MVLRVEHWFDFRCTKIRSMPRLPNHRFSMYQMRSGALIFMLSPQVKVNVEDMVFFRLWSDFSQIRTTKYSQNQCTRCHLVHWLWASEKLWALFAIDFGNSNHPRHRSWGPKPSRTLVFGIQTLTDIDFGHPNPLRHRSWGSTPSSTSILKMWIFILKLESAMIWSW